jgi:GTP-binding protein YchF
MSSTGLSVGIVGLPNVGKSTLFNALLKKQQALAANYPFATIEPNVGIVPVPDSRLNKLAEITKDEEKMTNLPPLKPATVEFVDIAGLVKGASEGAGLGNKFLSHIREVSVVAHVVRAFADENVIREGSVSPEEDYKTIVMELMIADMQSLEKQKDSKAVKMDKPRAAVIDKLLAGLNADKAVRDMVLTDEERELAKDMFLLSSKPEIIVLNVSEEDYTEEKIEQTIAKYTSILDIPEAKMVVICAKIEAELAALSEEEQQMYLADLGLKASGLERLIQKAYRTLGLISFLTAGEKEVRAWTIRDGMTAPVAAGEIHTDFIKKFIKAEVVAYDDFSGLNGWKKAREAGKARLEGKEYVMKDGDVVEFKIGA